MSSNGPPNECGLNLKDGTKLANIHTTELFHSLPPPERFLIIYKPRVRWLNSTQLDNCLITIRSVLVPLSKYRFLHCPHRAFGHPAPPSCLLPSSFSLPVFGALLIMFPVSTCDASATNEPPRGIRDRNVGTETR